MSFRSKKPASAKKVLSLALEEFMFVFAWAALSGALFFSFTLLWMYAFIPGALIAILSLASMELSGEGSPLVGLSIRQILPNTKNKITKKRIFFRIFTSVLLFPTALLGYIPLFFNKPSLPEILTKIRLVSINKILDPRPRSEIEKETRNARRRFQSLTYIPFVAAIAVFLLLQSTPKILLLQPELSESQILLSSSDQNLLTNYLELINLHPEELEYHVRIASLYYRNSMRQDLMNELDIIRTIDSTHAILLLADTTAIHFDNLIASPDTLLEQKLLSIPEPVAATTDSTESDSTKVEISSDSLTTDTLIIAMDSILTQESVLTDTVNTNPEIVLPAFDESEQILETEQEQLSNDSVTVVTENIYEPEEDIVEPDTATIVQP